MRTRKRIPQARRGGYTPPRPLVPPGSTESAAEAPADDSCPSTRLAALSPGERASCVTPLETSRSGAAAVQGQRHAETGEDQGRGVGDRGFQRGGDWQVAAVPAIHIKLTIIVDNGGFASIGSLSQSLGSQRFGTSYRYRNPDTGLLAANAASLGAGVLRAATVAEFRDALAQAKASGRTTVIHVQADPLAPAPSSDAWWDAPVAEVAELASTRKARAAYEEAKRAQRPYL